jgi:hypothetical protein
MRDFRAALSTRYVAASLLADGGEGPMIDLRPYPARFKLGESALTAFLVFR